MATYTYEMAGSVSGVLHVTMRTTGSAGGPGIEIGVGGGVSAWIVATRTTVKVSANQSGPGVTITLPSAPPEGHWRTIEVQVDGRTSGASARARTAGGAWSPWSALGYDARSADPSGAVVVWSLDPVYDIRVMSSDAPTDDPIVNLPRSAVVGLTGSRQIATFGTSGSGWSIIQDAARATLGAAWIDEDGRLIFRGRDRVRSGPTTETVIAEESLEDVPWSISVDEVADRIEVIYTAPVYATSLDRALTIWESTDVVMVLAGATVTVEQDLDVATEGISEWYPVWNTTHSATNYSRWNAFPNSDLTGTQPPNDALAIEATMLSATRLRLRIRNTTSGTLYVSQLTARSYMRVTQGEPRVLAWGLPESQARAPFTLDCGAWVQDEATAREILQWLAGTLSQPLPVLTGVRVVPDMARRLGSIVKVSDRTTALTAKAIITGIDTSHSPGSLEQRLDLTILSTTFDDVDTWLTREGLTTFDALDARLTALGLDTFDKLDDFLSRLGGTL